LLAISGISSLIPIAILDVMETHKTLEDSVASKRPLGPKITVFLLHWGIETHGYGYDLASCSFVLTQTSPRISPTLMEDRADKRLYQMFFVWFSANVNIFAISTGSAGPAFFKLGPRDSFLIILVVDLMYVQSMKVTMVPSFD
jgi:hypothetical protein